MFKWLRNLFKGTPKDPEYEALKDRQRRELEAAKLADKPFGYQWND